MPAEGGWRVVAGAEPPGAGAVHVWRAGLDRDPQAFRDLLSPEETARAARFRHPEAAARFVVGRGIVREILGSYLGEAPASLRLAAGARGKPALAPPHQWLRFNASISGALALVAVASGRDVGVDVEVLRPVPEAAAIAERMLSAGERAALRAVPAERLETAFLHCWTCKEAYIKAVGSGLWAGLDGFDVRFGPGEEACLLAVGGSAEAAAAWTLRALDPGPGYVAALAVEGRLHEVHTLEWSR